jgi:hypothetical protein
MHEVLVPVWVGIHVTLLTVAIARQVWSRVTGL